MSDQHPVQDPTPTPDAPAPPQPAKSKVIPLVAASAGLVLIAGGAVGLVLMLSQPSALATAGEACSGTEPVMRLLTEGEDAIDREDVDEDGEFAELFEGVVTVEDGGKTLIVSTKSQDDDPLRLSSLALDCVQEKMEMPSWLRESIGTTRALDGRQTGEWDSYSAQWSYHPDNGANLIIVQK